MLFNQPRSRLVIFREKIMACIEEQKLKNFIGLLAIVHSDSDLITVGEALEIVGTRGYADFVDAICSQKYILQISPETRIRTMTYAAQNNQAKIFDRLMLANCEQNRNTNVIASCLFLAAYEGHFDIVTLIFDKKADHISVTQLKSALKIAIEEDIEKLKRFFKNKLKENLTPEDARLAIQDVKRIIKLQDEYKAFTKLSNMHLNCIEQAEGPSSEKRSKLGKGF